MITRLHSAALLGIDGYAVDVEVDAFQVQDSGRISIVGLPDAAVKESIQRVTAAIANSDFLRPTSMVVTVNLAPADVRKQGPGFDLPIALAISMATQQNMEDVPRPLQRSIPQQLDSWCIVGELALDGTVRGTKGMLSLALAARDQGRQYLMVSPENAAEAAMVSGIAIYPVRTLAEAWDTLLYREKLTPYVAPPRTSTPLRGSADFEDVKGQLYARRALEIAAAGGHNILFCGSPGSGKSMLASRLPSILPPFSEEEQLEASKIHSVCGLLSTEKLLHQRPFRAPHHTISDVGLMGGGNQITPGEVSLAHRGVLFLDELPEFSRRALETLRQPLENGMVTISRASGTMDFPCDFMLLAAMNPCPCGYLGDARHHCRCSPADVKRYRKKISGPLLDRFDILIEVPAVAPADLLSRPDGEPSARMRERVQLARYRQYDRYAGRETTRHIQQNAQLSSKQLRDTFPLTESQKALLLQACDQFGLSARAFDRILRVALTIADLAGSERPSEDQLFEAIQLRQFEAQLRL